MITHLDLPRAGRRSRTSFQEPKRYTGLWVGIGSAVLSAGTQVYASQQQKKLQNQALNAQKGIAADIKYEPIDIEKLRTDAQMNAVANATASLAIERKLSPDVAATREELARQVRADLELGGNLPADVANRVTMAGRTIGARSGIGEGSTTPLTASLLGVSSLDLMNQRRNAASNLLGANALPDAGLDPGTIAGLEVAQNSAMNEFNLMKAGVDSNLASGEAAAKASQLGSQLGLISSGINLAATIGNQYANSRKGIGEKTTYDDFIKTYGKPGSASTPSYTPVDTSGFF